MGFFSNIYILLISNILLVFGVITCITLSVPFINMDKLSELNQMARVKTFFKVLAELGIEEAAVILDTVFKR